jgi:hypothetical protein
MTPAGTPTAAEDEQAAARRFALVATGVLAVGDLVAHFFWRPRAPGWLVVSLVAALLFALVLVRRRSVGSAAFVVAAGLSLMQEWSTNDVMAHSGVRFEPFIGFKLFALTMALLGPPSLVLGMGGIVVCAVLPVLEYALWLPDVRLNIPTPEPGTTLLYSALAAVLLLHRQAQMRTHREAVRAQAKTAALERMARKFLAVRDLTNSPLQSVEATVGLLMARHPESRVPLERIARQLERLQGLSVVLSRYEPREWTPGDGSFDPLAVLSADD